MRPLWRLFQNNMLLEHPWAGPLFENLYSDSSILNQNHSQFIKTARTFVKPNGITVNS